MTHLVPAPNVCLACFPNPKGAVGEAPICSYVSLIQPKKCLSLMWGNKSFVLQLPLPDLFWSPALPMFHLFLPSAPWLCGLETQPGSERHNLWHGAVDRPYPRAGGQCKVSRWSDVWGTMKPGVFSGQEPRRGSLQDNTVTAPPVSSSRPTVRHCVKGGTTPPLRLDREVISVTTSEALRAAG